MIEYEVKILDIDVPTITNVLEQLGYIRQKEKTFCRIIFDTSPADENKWVRLRTDGDVTTLTYKNFRANAIDGVEEVEVHVDNFDACKQLLSLAGLQSTSYQENRRTDFVGLAGSVQINIDTWPGIPPYMEIEGSNVAEVKATVKSLGLTSNRQTSVTTKEIYNLYGLNIDGKQELRFD